MLRHEVIDALRQGKRLCKHCMGKGFTMSYIPTDFPGDVAGYYKFPCKECNESGIEQEASKPSS
jgi:hypothetical protein